MKQLLFFLALCWLCSCNTLYVSQTKNQGNTPSIGVEWNYGDISNDILQQKIDSIIVAEMDRFNSQKHSFTVHRKKPRDKEKDYISVDFTKAKVVGTGGKIAGYVITGLGLATPIYLAATQQSYILAFYYWPNHSIMSKVTLSPNLSDERKNNKNLMVSTGALFASTNNQVEKMVRKYADGFHKTLLDIETQLGRIR